MSLESWNAEIRQGKRIRFPVAAGDWLFQDPGRLIEAALPVEMLKGLCLVFPLAIPFSIHHKSVVAPYAMHCGGSLGRHDTPVVVAEQEETEKAVARPFP